jgi:hypothetical protein
MQAVTTISVLRGGKPKATPTVSMAAKVRARIMMGQTIGEYGLMIKFVPRI